MTIAHVSAISCRAIFAAVLSASAAVVIAGCDVSSQEPDEKTGSSESALVCGETTSSAAATYTWSGVRGAYNVSATLVLKDSPPPACPTCLVLAPQFDLKEVLDPVCRSATPPCGLATQLRHTLGSWSVVSNGRSEAIQLNPDTTQPDYSSANPTYFDETKCHPLALATKEDDGSGSQITETWKRAH